MQGTSVLPTIRWDVVRDAAALISMVPDISDNIYGACVQLTLPTDESLRSRSTSTAGCRAACPTIIFSVNLRFLLL